MPNFDEGGAIETDPIGLSQPSKFHEKVGN